MNIGEEREARAAIEAVIMAAIEPVPPAVLAQLVELPTTRVEEICDELVAEYEREGRGFTIGRVAGGYRYQTHFDAYPYVERFVLDGQTARLSGPALETLAIIGYKQPISRAQLSAIRGVNVDATLKTLVARGYVEEVGHEPTPGNPVLFGTTTTFLERLGLDSLEELPALGDFVPDASIVDALERGLRVPTIADVVIEDDALAPQEMNGEQVDGEEMNDDEMNGEEPASAALAAELQSGLDDDV